MCVHATVAAVTALAATVAIEGGRLQVRTASGMCHVSWDDDTPPLVTVEQQTPTVGAVSTDTRRMEQALHLSTGAIDDTRPIQAVSVSRPKLIVPLRRAADVHAAVPDLDELWRMCRDGRRRPRTALSAA